MVSGTEPGVAREIMSATTFSLPGVNCVVLCLQPLRPPVKMQRLVARSRCGQLGSEGLVFCPYRCMCQRSQAHTQAIASLSPNEYLHSVGVRDLEANATGHSTPC